MGSLDAAMDLAAINALGWRAREICMQAVILAVARRHANCLIPVGRARRCCGLGSDLE